MLNRLRMEGFKSFRAQELRFSELTVLIGGNAAGKSNLCDALWLLQRLSGQDGPLEEVLDGESSSDPHLRGGTAAAFHRQCDELALEVDILLGSGLIRYRIELKRQGHGVRMLRESLRQDTRVLFDIRWQQESGATGFSSDRSVLVQNHRLKEPARSLAEQTRSFLSGLRFFHFDPEQIRQPCRRDASRVGQHGENTAACLSRLWESASQKQAALSWLEELTPCEFADLRFPTDARQRMTMELVEPDGLVLPGESASDGTLRYLALAALALGDPRGCCVFEELENGIYPDRLRLHLELLTQAARASGDFQAIVTTHAGALLDALPQDRLHSVYLLRRRGLESVAVPLTELPGIDDARKIEPLSVLHASGWFEQALGFEEDEP